MPWLEDRTEEQSLNDAQVLCSAPSFKKKLNVFIFDNNKIIETSRGISTVWCRHQTTKEWRERIFGGTLPHPADETQGQQSARLCTIRREARSCELLLPLLIARSRYWLLLFAATGHQCQVEGTWRCWEEIWRVFNEWTTKVIFHQFFPFLILCVW